MSEKKSKTGYNPKIIRIYDEDLKKILNNNYNVKENNKLSFKQLPLVAVITSIISFCILFAVNSFKLNNFMIILKEYLYSSLFIAVITFSIFIVLKKRK